jgi:hypothetical protein
MRCSLVQRVMNCSLAILASMASGNSGSEWYKLSHIQRVEAYADGGDKKKSYVLYTSEPYSMDTNIELNRQVNHGLFPECTYKYVFLNSSCLS